MVVTYLIKIGFGIVLLWTEVLVALSMDAMIYEDNNLEHLINWSVRVGGKITRFLVKFLWLFFVLINFIF